MPLAGGIKTDIRTGNPILETPESKKAEMEDRLQQAVNRSVAMQAELKDPKGGGLVVEAMIEQMIVHATLVLANDPVYANFLKVLKRLDLQINIAPRVVERHLKRVLPSYERQAAPEGIPASGEQP